MIIYTAGEIKVHLDSIDYKLPILQSYFYLTDSKMDHILGKCDKFFLDSGAFSAFTRNIEVDIDKYIEFIYKFKDRMTVYSVLDNITDWKKTQKNLEYMESKGVNPLPCYHYGEPIEILEKMVEKYEYIAIGGMVPISTKDLYPFLDMCFNIICDSNGNAKIKVHGFGMTTLQLIQKYPWHSVDSTSPLMTAAMGGIYAKNGKVISLSQNKIMSGDIKKYIEENYNESIEDLRNDYKIRFKINVEYFQCVSKELTDSPPKFINNQLKLF